MSRGTPLVFLLAICLLSASTAVGATPIEWSPGSGGNGHYYELVLERLSWSTAKLHAESLGGYLATMTSQAENDYVLGLYKDVPQAWGEAYNEERGPWLGGFAPDGQGSNLDAWQWVTGEAWSFTAWYPGQPYPTSETRLQYVWEGYGSGIPTPTSEWNNYFDWAHNCSIVEYNSDPSAVPEPASCALLGVAVTGFAAALRRRKRRAA